MKEKRGAIYGIGIALVLFGLISVSVLPNVSRAATWKVEGGAESEGIDAQTTCDVDIDSSGDFYLRTTLDTGPDGSGAGVYAGQGIIMGGNPNGIKWIEDVKKLQYYREQEDNGDEFILKEFEWKGYTRETNGDYITRTDEWYYEGEYYMDGGHYLFGGWLKPSYTFDSGGPMSMDK